MLSPSERYRILGAIGAERIDEDAWLDDDDDTEEANSEDETRPSADSDCSGAESLCNYLSASVSTSTPSDDDTLFSPVKSSTLAASIQNNEHPISFGSACTSLITIKVSGETSGAALSPSSKKVRWA